MPSDDWMARLRHGLRQAVDVAVEAARRPPSDGVVFSGRQHSEDTRPVRQGLLGATRTMTSNIL